MARKKDQLSLQVDVETNEEWETLFEKQGLWVIDVYRSWSGPCDCMQSTLKRLKINTGSDILQFARACADNIADLSCFTKTCEPQWLFLADGEPLHYLKGSSIPKLTKAVLEYLALEEKIAEGKAERKIAEDIKRKMTQRIVEEEEADEEDGMDEDEKLESNVDTNNAKGNYEIVIDQEDENLDESTVKTYVTEEGNTAVDNKSIEESVTVIDSATQVSIDKIGKVVQVNDNDDGFIDNISAIDESIPTAVSIEQSDTALEEQN